ncbi:MAG: type IV pilus biogenesis/stability protein PilW [Gammaproteobacteria bacterium]|nr:type IV pilus biogenesis/stability protein PilW [Gammaproteobacteria bacterium]
MKRNSRLLIILSALLMSACVTTGGKPEPSKQQIKDAASYNLQLGISYMQMGQMQLALEKMQRSLTQDPDRADAHMALAVLYTRLGELEKARSEYRRSLHLDPDNSLTLNNYGAFLCKQGDYDDAIKNFDKAVKNPLYQTPAAAYSNAGLCSLDQGRDKQAERYFRLSLQANPRFTTSLLQMADLSFTDKIYLQARAFMDRYMASVATAATADALWLGVRVEEALGDLAAAGAYSTQLLENFPDSVEARQFLEAEQNAG